MNTTQAKIEFLERTIKKINLKLKSANGNYRKFLLFDLLATHRTLSKLNNL